jgi:hypothetical protein
LPGLSFIVEQIVHDHVVKADIVPRAGWLLVLFIGRVFLSVLDILFVFIPVCKKHGSTLLLKKAVWIAFGFIRCLEYITKAVRLSGQQEIFFLGVGAPDFRSLQLRGRVSERSHEVYTAALAPHRQAWIVTRFSRVAMLHILRFPAATGKLSHQSEQKTKTASPVT